MPGPGGSIGGGKGETWGRSGGWLRLGEQVGQAGDGKRGEGRWGLLTVQANAELVREEMGECVAVAGEHVVEVRQGDCEVAVGGVDEVDWLRR